MEEVAISWCYSLRIFQISSMLPVVIAILTLFTNRVVNLLAYKRILTVKHKEINDSDHPIITLD